MFYYRVKAGIVQEPQGICGNPVKPGYGSAVDDASGTVRAGYDLIGPRYRDWSRHSPVRLHWVGRLLDQLTPNSLVLDLGCGPGEPATRLLTERHRVIGVDASYEQLRLAKHAAPPPPSAPPHLPRPAVAAGSLDAVASFYALGHVPSDRHAALMHAISTWLRPGGLLLTSAPLSPGDGHEPDWLGVPMFFGGIGEAP